MIRKRNPAKKRSCSSPSGCNESLRQNKKLKHTTVILQKENDDVTEDEEQKLLHELRELDVRVFKEREVNVMTDELCEVLGEGSFGSCIKTVDPDTHQQLVIKTFFSDDFDDLLQETKNLLQVQMEGVQRLVGVCVEGHQIISHFAGTNVNDYFKNHVPLPDAATIFLQAARTCKRIRKKGLAHNDLHDGNVCVSNGSSGPVVTIIDLGVATPVCKSTTLLKSKSSSPMASEALEVYEIGKMMYTLMCSNKAWTQNPLDPAVVSWVEAATSFHPAQRPSLEALEEVLEAILEQASNSTLPATTTTVRGENFVLSTDVTLNIDAWWPSTFETNEFWFLSEPDEMFLFYDEDEWCTF